jgi:hypothetical protein
LHDTYAIFPSGRISISWGVLGTSMRRTTCMLPRSTTAT